MYGKQNLINEIQTKPELTSNLFLQYFKDPKEEQLLNNFDKERFHFANILIGVVIFASNLLNFTVCYQKMEMYWILMIIGIATSIDLLLLVLYLKTDFSNSKYNDIFKYTKFILNMLFSFFIFIVYLLFESESKEVSLLRNLTVNGTMLFLEYLFMIKMSSKLICYFIYSSYILLYLLATFTTYKLEIVYSDSVRLMLSKSCNSLVDYTTMTPINKQFNKIVIDEVLANYSLANGITNGTSNYPNSSINDFNIDIIEEVIDDSIVQASNQTGTNSTNQENNISNIYPLSFYEYSYIEYTNKSSLYLIFSQDLHILPHEEQCLVYYFSDVLEFNYINFPLYLSNLEKKVNYALYLHEIIACIVFFFLFFISDFFHNYRREVYLHVRENENLMNYFDLLFNSLKTEVVSFSNKKILYYNEEFKKNLTTGNSNSNLCDDSIDKDNNPKSSSPDKNFTRENYNNLSIESNTYNLNINNKINCDKKDKIKYRNSNCKNSNDIYVKVNANSELTLGVDETKHNLNKLSKSNLNQEGIIRNNTKYNEDKHIIRENNKICSYLKNFIMIETSSSNSKENGNNNNNDALQNVINNKSLYQVLKENQNNKSNKDNKNNIDNKDRNNLIEDAQTIKEVENLQSDISNNYNTYSNNNKVQIKEEIKETGIFINNDRFYKVYLRNYYHKYSKLITDIFLYDITEIKQAEKISFETKLKQKLFSKMAHEFKTPLIIIKSLITDLVNPETKNNEKIYDYIYYISDYINFLINDIIYYTNNNDVKIQIEETDLKELMEFCQGVAKSLIAVMPGNKQNVKVNFSFDSRINYFCVNSDKTKLKQVMLNFISNAVKFTKFGEILLSAKLVLDNEKYNEYCNDNINKKPKYHISLLVQDSGIGIKEEDLEKIKNNHGKILSINTDYAYNQMGTGLGLGIAKTLIKSMGHSLEVHSVYGKGSSFIVNIDAIDLKENIRVNDINEYDDINKFNINYENNDSISDSDLSSYSFNEEKEEYNSNKNSEETVNINNKTIEDSALTQLLDYDEHKIFNYNHNINSDKSILSSKISKLNIYFSDCHNKENIDTKDTLNKKYSKSHLNSASNLFNPHYYKEDNQLTSLPQVLLKKKYSNNVIIRKSNNNINNINNNKYYFQLINNNKSISNESIIDVNSSIKITERNEMMKKRNSMFITFNNYNKYEDYKFNFNRNISSLDNNKLVSLKSNRHLSCKGLKFSINRSGKTVNNKFKDSSMFISSKQLPKIIEFDSELNEANTNNFQVSKKNDSDVEYIKQPLLDRSFEKIKEDDEMKELNTSDEIIIKSKNNKKTNDVKSNLNTNINTNINIINNNNNIIMNNAQMKVKLNKKAFNNIYNNNSGKKKKSMNKHAKDDNTDIISNISNICNDDKLKIMIVDDTETMKSSLKNLLNSIPKIKSEFSIIEGNDGVDILNKVIQDQIHGSRIKIIITDENMEYMSGSTAISIIRELEKQSKILPIFIVSLTAFADDDNKNEIIKKGANVVLCKPISKKNLNDLMEDYFKYNSNI